MTFTISTPTCGFRQKIKEWNPKHLNASCVCQVTSASGALCVINPLYLQEHGDDWLTQQPISVQRPARLIRERRLSTTRPWEGAGLIPKRAISLDQDCCSVGFDVTGVCVCVGKLTN